MRWIALSLAILAGAALAAGCEEEAPSPATTQPAAGEDETVEAISIPTIQPTGQTIDQALAEEMVQRWYAMENFDDIKPYLADSFSTDARLELHSVLAIEDAVGGGRPQLGHCGPVQVHDGDAEIEYTNSEGDRKLMRFMQQGEEWKIASVCDWIDNPWGDQGEGWECHG